MENVIQNVFPSVSTTTIITTTIIMDATTIIIIITTTTIIIKSNVADAMVLFSGRLAPIDSNIKSASLYIATRLHNPNHLVFVKILKFHYFDFYETQRGGIISSI